MQRVTLIGIDLAKHVFELRGVDSQGHAVVHKKMNRKDLILYMANHPPCCVVMEACGGAHYWARLFERQGHEPKIIAAQFVKPFRATRQKNDRLDAVAIVEAAQRPGMRFVARKNLFQQDIQSLHRMRDLIVSSRIRVTNQMHGLFLEYGVTLPEGIPSFKKEFRIAIEDANNELTPVMRELAQSLYKMFEELIAEQKRLESRIKVHSRQDDNYRRILKVPGVGPMTASLFLAAVGNASVFKNGRHVAAWLGLVPRQNSSGGIERLGRITKSGDSHLRAMLVQGARSAIVAAIKKQKQDPLSEWMLRLQKEKGWNKAVVALANRNARIAWHLLKYEEEYRSA